MRPESTMIDLGSPLIPRSYELEIVAVAKYRNTLAFLPTLHGKNLISLLLIKHRLDRVKIIDSFLEISIAILVPTRWVIATVNQLKHCLHRYILFSYRTAVNEKRAYIEAHCGSSVVVRAYVGDTSKNGRKLVDWTAENWRQEVREVDVMIFIPQILKDVLQRKLLPVSAFDLFGESLCKFWIWSLQLNIP